MYFNENKRGTDLLSGVPYITGLDLQNIQKILLDFKGDSDIVLTKKDEHFILENHKSYPADMEKVNDLLYQISSIEVKEKVVSHASEKNLKDYELNEELKRIAIKLYDSSGQEVVSFNVGKDYNGRGEYLIKSNEKTIYLSKQALVIGSLYSSYIDKNLLANKRRRY